MGWKVESRYYPHWIHCSLLRLKVCHLIRFMRLDPRLVSIAGIRNIVLGSAHRGRLNILTELLGCSYAALFHKIKGGCEFPADLGVTGDVLSHLGECKLYWTFFKNLTGEYSRLTLPELRRVIRTNQGFAPTKSLPSGLVFRISFYNID